MYASDVITVTAKRANTKDIVFTDDSTGHITKSIDSTCVAELCDSVGKLIVENLIVLCSSCWYLWNNSILITIHIPPTPAKADT